MVLLSSAVALAGRLDGQVALDYLGATSHAEGPSTGPSENLAAHELGMSLRADFRELDDRLRVRLDYRGREPIAGTFPNTARRLLYQAEISYHLVPQRLTVSAGLFAAATPTFLLVDGLQLTYTSKAFSVGGFGGRRGVSSALQTLGVKDWLPALGVWGSLHLDRVQGLVSFAYHKDRVLVASGGDGEGLADDVGGLTALARASVQPIDQLDVGAQVSFAQAATYRMGPTWVEAQFEAAAFGLFNAWGWANVKPAPWLRVELDGGHQTVQAYRVGTVDADGIETDDAVQQPRFTDVRLGARIGPPAIGWLRPTLRYRVRPSGAGPSEGARTELRAGIRLDIDDFGIPGPYVTASAAFDDVGGAGAKDDIGTLDRTYGRAAVGFRKAGFDGAIGGSYVERAALPVSGRRLSAADQGIPDSSEDLQPFTLEADPILFGRVFYSGRRFFGGADVEKHLKEAEFRVFLQVGVLAGVGW